MTDWHKARSVSLVRTWIGTEDPPYVTLWEKTKRCILSLWEKICKEQMFEFRERKNGGREVQSVEITVFDYFVNYRNIKITFSGDFPCINVGKPKKPTYLPLELCELVSLQRYTKALSTTQRATLVEKSRQKPDQRLRVLTDALRTSNYGSDPLLRSSGISINNHFAQVNGRLLLAPKKLGAAADSIHLVYGSKDMEAYIW